MPEPFFEIRFSPAGNKAYESIRQRLKPAQIFDEFAAVFKQQAPKVADYIRRNKVSGQVLNQQSGDLARGIEGMMMRQGRGIPAIRVGVFRGRAVTYAGIQEEGTNDLNPKSPYPPITPKRANALAWAPDTSPAHGTGLGPREWGADLKFVPFRGGRVAIGALYDSQQLTMARKGGGAFSLRSLTAVFVLLRQVSIPAHHYLRDGMTEYLPLLAKAAEDHFKGVFRA